MYYIAKIKKGVDGQTSRRLKRTAIRVEMVVRVHYGTALPQCSKYVPANSPTMHFETISIRSPTEPPTQTFLGVCHAFLHHERRSWSRNAWRAPKTSVYEASLPRNFKVANIIVRGGSNPSVYKRVGVGVIWSCIPWVKEVGAVSK